MIVGKRKGTAVTVGGADLSVTAPSLTPEPVRDAEGQAGGGRTSQYCS